MAKNSYPRVIDILSTCTLDHRALCVALAKHYPTIFLKIVDMVQHEDDKREEALKVDSVQEVKVKEAEVLKGGIIEYRGYKINTEEPWYKEFKKLNESNKMIASIKLLREHIDIGLPDAKDFYYLQK